MYKQCVDMSVKIDPRNMIAVKVSAFGDIEMMKKINTLQSILEIVEEGLIKNNTTDAIMSNINKRKLESKITIEHIEKLKNIFPKIKSFDLNVYELLLNTSQNKKIIEILNEIMSSNQELLDLIEFCSKLDKDLGEVFNYSYKHDCLIMIDAEQSYIQIFFDYLTAYYFKQFNKEKCFLLQTLQCYLKKEPESLIKWREFCDDKGLKLGIKIVRGAYISEECRIAEKIGIEPPTCKIIEDTHKNYNKTIESLFKNYKNGDKVN